MANIDINRKEKEITSEFQIDIAEEAIQLDIPITFNYETFELDIDLTSEALIGQICNQVGVIAGDALSAYGIPAVVSGPLASRFCESQLGDVVQDLAEALDPDGALNRKVESIRTIAESFALDLLINLPSPETNGLPLGPPLGSRIAPITKGVSNIGGKEGVRTTNIIQIPYKQTVEIHLRMVSQGVVFQEEGTIAWLYKNQGTSEDPNIVDVLHDKLRIGNEHCGPIRADDEFIAYGCLAESGIFDNEYARIEVDTTFILEPGFYILAIGNTDTGGHNQIEVDLTYNVITREPPSGIPRSLLFGGGLGLGLLLYLSSRRG